MGNKIAKNCIQCGKRFEVIPYRVSIAKYCSLKCHGLYQGYKKGNSFQHKVNKGREHYKWSGGRKKHGKYIAIYSPNHPFTRSDKYVFEHRLVMEKKLGRYLQPREVIHHINHNPTDNRVENLQLITNQSEHIKHEHRVGSFPQSRA